MLCSIFYKVLQWGQPLVCRPWLKAHIFIASLTGTTDRKLSGMAIRQCVELGYHRSTERYRPHADALTKELSKRCFWVAYDLDCVSSFILGRPKGIPDNAIDAEVSYAFH